MKQQLLSAVDAARYVGVTYGSLANMRVAKVGPLPTRVGGRIFYSLTELDNFNDHRGR